MRSLYEFHIVIRKLEREAEGLLKESVGASE